MSETRKTAGKKLSVRYCSQGHIFDACAGEECPYCRKRRLGDRRLKKALEEERRKKVKSIWMFLLLTALLRPVSAAAMDLEELKNHVSGNCLTVYMPEENYAESSVSIQVGSSEILDGELRPLEGSAQIRTMILIDNSLSISVQNRERMKNLLKLVVGNGRDGEEFALAVFDTEVHLLAEMTSNKETILQALEGIEFQNQFTWLNNCLYDTIGDPALFSPESYARILVCSDGSEDNPYGYTREDVLQKLRSCGCELLAAGSVYEEDPGAAVRLMSLARGACGKAWLLDDCGDDLSGAAEEIRKETPGRIAVAEMPERLLDGSEKRVQIRTRTENGFFTAAATVRMPFSETVEDTQEEEQGGGPGEETVAAPHTESAGSSAETEEAVRPSAAASVRQEEEPAADEPQDQEGHPGGLPRTAAFCIPPAAAAAALLLVRFRKRKKREEEQSLGSGEQEYHDPEWPSSEEKFTVMREEAPDECTVLMEKTDDPSCMLTLLSDPDGREVCTVPVLREVMVGRKPDCAIVLRGDPSVSGHHCVIYRVRDDLILRDNASSNGTWLNDVKIEEPVKLESGDVLGIGKRKWTVKFDLRGRDI